MKPTTMACGMVPSVTPTRTGGTMRLVKPSQSKGGTWPLRQRPKMRWTNQKAPKPAMHAKPMPTKVERYVFCV